MRRIGGASTVKVVPGVARSRQWPFGLGPPAVGPHHEQLDRWPVLHPVALPFEPVVEPGARNLEVISRCLRAEVDFPHSTVPLGRSVGPRSDDQPGSGPGPLGTATPPHPGEVLDRPNLLVVPAGRDQGGHFDPRMFGFQIEMVSGMVPQPVAEMFAHPRHRVLGDFHQGKEPEPFGPVVVGPLQLRHLLVLGSPLQTRPAAGVDGQTVDAPGQDPADAKDSSQLTIQQVGRHPLRQEALEVGRPHMGQLPLRPTHVGVAECSHSPVGFRQAGRPLHGVESVFRVAMVRGQEAGPELAVRGVAPAHILGDDEISSFAEPAADLRMGLLVIRGSAKQGGEGALPFGDMEIGPEQGAVPHRCGDVLANLEHLGGLPSADPIPRGRLTPQHRNP